METETYKNAKLILERFDLDPKKKIVSHWSVYMNFLCTMETHVWWLITAFLLIVLRSWRLCLLDLLWLLGKVKVRRKAMFVILKKYQILLSVFISRTNICVCRTSSETCDSSWSCYCDSQPSCRSTASSCPCSNSCPPCPNLSPWWAPREKPVCCWCPPQPDEETCHPCRHPCPWDGWEALCYFFLLLNRTHSKQAEI